MKADRCPLHGCKTEKVEHADVPFPETICPVCHGVDAPEQ